MNFVTMLGFSAAVCTTTSFLPQAIKTIQTKDTSGISLSMYSILSLGTLLWLLYGLVNNDLPVLIANGITFIFAVIILVYKIRYK